MHFTIKVFQIVHPEACSKKKQLHNTEILSQFSVDSTYSETGFPPFYIKTEKKITQEFKCKN